MKQIKKLIDYCGHESQVFHYKAVQTYIALSHYAL